MKRNKVNVSKDNCHLRDTGVIIPCSVDLFVSVPVPGVALYVKEEAVIHRPQGRHSLHDLLDVYVSLTLF